jgi:hypothetical protein
MSLTKLDVAEREIVAAIRLFFDGGDPIAVYVVAAAAREITSTLCEKRGIPSFLDGAHHKYPQHSKKEIFHIAGRFAGFFKHARDDPDAVLDDFDEAECEAVLLAAIDDFARLCGGLPIEAQVFDVWFRARHLPSDNEAQNELQAAYLPDDFDRQSRLQQIESGKRLLAWALAQPALFQMPY